MDPTHSIGPDGRPWANTHLDHTPVCVCVSTTGTVCWQCNLQPSDPTWINLIDIVHELVECFGAEFGQLSRDTYHTRSHTTGVATEEPLVGNQPSRVDTNVQSHLRVPLGISTGSGFDQNTHNCIIFGTSSGMWLWFNTCILCEQRFIHFCSLWKLYTPNRPRMYEIVCFVVPFAFLCQNPI
jgi:hypothetical protein